MRAPLHALVVGSAVDLAVGDGVRARPWASLEIELDGGDLAHPALGLLGRRAVPDTTPLLDADVLVFRPPYATAAVCMACGVADLDPDALLVHGATTGHPWRRPYEAAVRGLVEAFLADPERLRGRGVVVELADDPRSVRWDADLRVDLELALTDMLLRIADGVVAGTPTAEAAARRAGARDVALIAPGEAAEAGHRAAAYRDAATRAGTGLARAAGGNQTLIETLAELAARRLDHRLEVRGLDTAMAASSSAGRVPSAGGAVNVTVVIPVVGASAVSVARAAASALDDAHLAVEVVLAGDAATASAAADALADPRVRLAAGATAMAQDASAAGGSPAVAAVRAQGEAIGTGIAAARGAWFTVLRPDAILLPGGLGALCGAAAEHGLDLAYGRVLLVHGGDGAGRLGSWPPSASTVPQEAALFGGLAWSVAADPDAWLDGEDVMASLIRRGLALGFRAGLLDDTIAVRELALSAGAEQAA